MDITLQYKHSLTYVCFFFFNDTATTEIYTLSLHDALPITSRFTDGRRFRHSMPHQNGATRSEEHTSELQSRFDLVCRLLLEKKKTNESSCKNRYLFLDEKLHFLPRNSITSILLFFFFNDTATTEIYTLSLHDALPI